MNATQEQWRPIPGWEGLYEVSNLGRVRSLDRITNNGTQLRRGRVLTAKVFRSSGYLIVQLYDGDRRSTEMIHHLVARVFLGDRQDGQQVRHLNDDKHDNRAANLSYGSFSDNAWDKVRNGKHFPAYRDACKHGHEYTPENTRITVKRGYTYRQCRTCVRNYSQAAERRKKEGR